MKISYILPDFDERACSGGLYVIFEHCNGLIRRGHDVKVFNNVGKKSMYLRLDCAVQNHGNDPAAVEKNSPDIVVATHWRTWFFVDMMKNLLQNGTTPFLLIQSDDRFLVSDEERPFVEKAMTASYGDIAPFKKIAVSRYLQEMMRSVYGQDCLYLPNGLENKSVEPLLPPSDKLRIAARYDTSAYRGWDTVNAALKRITIERNNAQIHLFEMKKKPPTKYKSILHRGLTGDRLLGLLKSCDIYVAGSSHEGFSYPTLEAMSQGCCIAATDAGGNREFCVDGETALLSLPNDSERLYKNILALVDDKGLRERIRRSGIAKSREFVWEDTIDELEKIFKTASPYKVCKENEDCARKNNADILFIYRKDPFGCYEQWTELDTTVKYLRNLGYGVETLLYVDRHPAKAVKARLKMLMPKDLIGTFRYKIFYIKKLKMPLGIFGSLMFDAWVLFKLAGTFSRRHKLSVLIFSEKHKSLLTLFCRALKIKHVNRVFGDTLNLENSLTNL